MSTINKDTVPSLVLPDEQSVRDFIADPQWPKGLDMYTVRPEWLIALINEYMATGKYPYNRDIQRLAEDRLGMPHGPCDGEPGHGPLVTLVYDAQCWRHEDERRAKEQALLAAGYQFVTQEFIDLAWRTKQKVELANGTVLHAREVYGNRYLMKPGARSKYINCYGALARLIPSTKKLVDKFHPSDLAILGGDPSL